MGSIYRINIRPERMGQFGIPKLPVLEARITDQGIAGDFTSYRRQGEQDDLDTALLLLPREVITALNAEGWEVLPGDLGENLTTMDVPYDLFRQERIYRVGSSALIQISRECTPRRNLYCLPYVGEERGPEFLAAIEGRCGWYARVLMEGDVHVKDGIEVLLR